MPKDKSFSHQFRGGYYPQEHWDESDRQNGHEISSPNVMRRRLGVAYGSQTEANPGMVGKQDYKHKMRKR
jgi:hypothetical protein